LNVCQASFMKYSINFSTINKSALHNFTKISAQIAHNVPAVYDGLAARISVCAANAGPTNCGWSEPWEGAKRLT
jgi:hypothetical protein